MTGRGAMRCAINQQDILSIDPRIYIQDIREAIQAEPETMARPGYGSYLIGHREHDTLTVTVRLKIKICDRSSFAGLAQKINGWANRGWLTVSYRPGQRLYVLCTKRADFSIVRPKADLELIFTAYGEAYWQDEMPTAAKADKVSDTALFISPRGTRRCFLEATVKNAGSATVDTVHFFANGAGITFSGLAMAAGETLVMDYDEAHFLRAVIGERRVLSARTAESADDVPLYPGRENTVSFAADGPCDVTMYARGMYE